MSQLSKTQHGRFFIFDAGERLRVQWEYFQCAGLKLLPDKDEPFRSEFGVAMLPASSVVTSSDRHEVEVTRNDEGKRFSFRLVQEGVTRLVSPGTEPLEAKSGECLVTRHLEGQKLRFSPGRRSVLTLEEDAIRDFVQRHYNVDTPKDLSFGETFRIEGTPLADLLPIIDTLIDSRIGEAQQECVQLRVQDALIGYIVEHAPNNCKLRLSRASNRVLPHRARRAREFILANLERSVTLADIAAAACCSPRQLQLTFQDSFEMSPLAMLKKLRLEAAAARLKDGDCESISALAHSFGYSNPGRFASEFRHQFGCKPSDFSRFGQIRDGGGCPTSTGYDHRLPRSPLMARA